MDTPVQNSTETIQPTAEEIKKAKLVEQPAKNNLVNFLKTTVMNKKFIPYLIVVAILMVIAIAVGIYVDKNSVQTPKPKPKPQEPIAVIEDPKWKEFSNRQYEFSVTYPTEANIIEENPFSLDPSSYTILYTRLDHKETDLNEYNMREGYLFRIIVNKTENTQTPEELSQSKQTVFYSQCPEEVKLSEIGPLTVTEFPATSFEVTECNGVIKHTYVKRNNRVFEVTQFYKGDLGYRERYAATIDEIMRSFDLTNTNEPLPSENWIEYLNKSAQISFKHPDMDSKCCNITGPILVNDQVEKEDVEKIIVFARKGTPKESSKPYDGFAVYLVKDVGEKEFVSYVEQQKRAFEDNYKVIIGKTPTGRTTDVVVGGKEGVLLEGYAWWGDIIFVPDGSRTVSISQTEAFKDSFNNEFGEVLNTFKFEVDQ